jgi:hypothetical protein
MEAVVPPTSKRNVGGRLKKKSIKALHIYDGRLR